MPLRVTTKVSPAATASITLALSLRSSRCAMVWVTNTIVALGATDRYRTAPRVGGIVVTWEAGSHRSRKTRRGNGNASIRENFGQEGGIRTRDLSVPNAPDNTLTTSHEERIYALTCSVVIR